MPEFEIMSTENEIEIEDTDQLAEPDEEITEDEEQAEEPDPRIAELEAKLKEAEEKEARLAEWEKKINARSTELGAIAKRLEQQEVAPPSSEAEFDPETLSQFKAALKAVGIDPEALKDTVTTTQETLNAQREAIFFQAVQDGVDGQDLYAALMDIGVNPEKATPIALEKAVSRVAPGLKAAKLDVDTLKKQAVEEYLAGLKKKGAKEDEIVEVKKGRGSTAGSYKTIEDVLADKSLDAFQRQALIDKMSEVID